MAPAPAPTSDWSTCWSCIPLTDLGMVTIALITLLESTADIIFGIVWGIMKADLWYGAMSLAQGCLSFLMAILLVIGVYKNFNILLLYMSVMSQNALVYMLVGIYMLGGDLKYNVSISGMEGSRYYGIWFICWCFIVWFMVWQVHRYWTQRRQQCRSGGLVTQGGNLTSPARATGPTARARRTGQTPQRRSEQTRTRQPVQTLVTQLPPGTYLPQGTYLPPGTYLPHGTYVLLPDQQRPGLHQTPASTHVSGSYPPRATELDSQLSNIHPHRIPSAPGPWAPIDHSPSATVQAGLTVRAGSRPPPYSAVAENPPAYPGGSHDRSNSF